jgi:hypothetical protein
MVAVQGPVLWPTLAYLITLQVYFIKIIQGSPLRLGLLFRNVFMYSFMVYLMTLSVAQTTWRRKVGCQENDDLKIMLKEAVVV